MSVEIDGFPVTVATSLVSAKVGLPNIVMVHGAQGDHRAWDKQLTWFGEHGYSAFAPDLPGHGQSGGSPLASIEAMGQWLGKLLEQVLPVGADETNAKPETTALQDGRAKDALLVVADDDTPSMTVLVGHSMGSLAALECAALQANRVAALVLVGTAFPMRVSSSLLEQARNDEQAAFGQIAQWSYAPDAPEANEAARAQRRERLARAEQFMLSQAPSVLHTDLNACNNYQRGLEVAGSISCPVLVVAGSKDQMTAPKFAVGLQQALRAEFHLIEGAGHAMMDEVDEALCAVIDQFLSQHLALPKLQA